MTRRSAPKGAPAAAASESTPWPPFSEALTAAIDKAHAHADRARELGWPTIAAVFTRCAADLAGLVPPGEREP